jgi:hypothetical protein
MFAFTGRGIHFGVFYNERVAWVQGVEVGFLDTGSNDGGEITKYCVMRLSRAHGRRYTNLINVVKEYNTAAGGSWSVEVLNLKSDSGVELPLILTPSMHPTNKILCKLTMDKAAYRAGGSGSVSYWKWNKD